MTSSLGLAACALAILGLATVGCGGGSSTPPDPLRSGLIHWWRLDGNANDSAGTLNGVVKGPIVFSPGMYGQAAVGNGQTTGIAIPDAVDMELQGPFTLSAWVKSRFFTGEPAFIRLSSEVNSCLARSMPSVGPSSLIQPSRAVAFTPSSVSSDCRLRGSWLNSCCANRAFS